MIGRKKPKTKENRMVFMAENGMKVVVLNDASLSDNIRLLQNYTKTSRRPLERVM